MRLYGTDIQFYHPIKVKTITSTTRHCQLQNKTSKCLPNGIEVLMTLEIVKSQRRNNPILWQVDYLTTFYAQKIPKNLRCDMKPSNAIASTSEENLFFFETVRVERNRRKKVRKNTSLRKDEEKRGEPKSATMETCARRNSRRYACLCRGNAIVQELCPKHSRQLCWVKNAMSKEKTANPLDQMLTLGENNLAGMTLVSMI